MRDDELVSAASLIKGARRDLSYAEELLAAGGDRLVAIVAVARAAKRADEAAFALLEEPRRTRSGIGSKYPAGV